MDINVTKIKNQRKSVDYYISVIKSISIKSKYTKWYINIIKNVIYRGHSKYKFKKENNSIYVESHHILPKSFGIGGEKDKNNIALLTAKEHFICHWLLTKMFLEKSFKIKMCSALGRLTNNHTSNYTSLQYTKSKINFINSMNMRIELGIHPFQTDKCKENVKKHLEKSLREGKHNSQNKDFLEKNSIRNLELYQLGIHPFQNPDVRFRANKTNLENNVKPKVANGTYVLQRTDVRIKNSIRITEYNYNSNPNDLPHVKEMRSKLMSEMNKSNNPSKVPFLSLIENRKTYPKNSISRYFPEFKQYY